MEVGGQLQDPSALRQTDSAPVNIGQLAGWIKKGPGAVMERNLFSTSKSEPRFLGRSPRSVLAVI
jgi:hypothetical protein